MNEERIALLKKYIAEEPNEPFNHYALANEYIAEDAEKALAMMKGILTKFPDYLPTYYQTAGLLESFEAEQEALTIYEQGIALAKKLGNTKIERELQTAWQNLSFEMD